MESPFQVGTFIVSGFLLFVGLFAQSMRSIDRNLRERQVGMKR